MILIDRKSRHNMIDIDKFELSNKNKELLKLAKESYESYNYFKIRFNQI